ncbi:MAG: glycosyltransferase family 4 protein [Anaerolineae bacterium]|nr:glycosyltransferase family 4 protein [Anaerolineae bacterium]
MHIALSGWFWQHSHTGSGQYLHYLLGALSRLHPEARFSLLVPDSAVTLQATASNVALIPVPLPTSLQRFPLGKVYWEQVSVPWVAKKLAVDLLHIPYWSPPVSCAPPTVVTIHDLIPLLLPAYRQRWDVRLYTRLVSATAARATLLITDSAASRADIIQHLNVPGHRVRSIWLAADDAYHPQPSPNDVAVLDSLGLAPGYILYLGGFDSRKNVAAVFQAFAIVRHIVPGLQLVVAGKLPELDTDFAPDPRRLAYEAELESTAVQFTGFVPEEMKPSLYRGARVFLFPSYYEGFGLPPLESLSCGVPVVGSATSSLPEVVAAGGILVPPADITGQANALIRLLTDNEFYTNFQRLAIQQASKFSWQKTAEATWQAYLSVM